MKIQNRYKPLIFIGAGVLILVIFFVFVTRKGPVDKAIKELQGATTYESVKAIWNTHRTDLVNKSKWSDAVQAHLSNMSLTGDQQKDLVTWFPVKNYINVVVLPDLSGRLVTKPFPIENDKVVLEYILNAFQESVNKSYKLYGENTKDRLMIDMTRERELDLKDLANKLIIDCSKTEQPSIPYIASEKNEFRQSVEEVYEIARKQTQGADYFKYINENLNDRRVDSSPFVKYRNLVVILTDGYLEITKNPTVFYTGSPNQLAALVRGRSSGQDWNQLFSSQHLLIQDKAASTPNLKDWEVLILQVRDRENGDYEILEKLWSDWLTKLDAKWTPGLSFQKYQIAPANNKNTIAKFFNIESSKIVNPISSTHEVAKQESVDKAAIDQREKYNDLLTEADQAVSVDDFGKGKLLLRKAAQLKQTSGSLASDKADAMYQKYVSFADKAYQTFLDTKTTGLGNIPIQYYELAALIKPGDEIQRKLVACRANL